MSPTSFFLYSLAVIPRKLVPWPNTCTYKPLHHQIHSMNCWLRIRVKSDTLSHAKQPVESLKRLACDELIRVQFIYLLLLQACLCDFTGFSLISLSALRLSSPGLIIKCFSPLATLGKPGYLIIALQFIQTGQSCPNIGFHDKSSGSWQIVWNCIFCDQGRRSFALTPNCAVVGCPAILCHRELHGGDWGWPRPQQIIGLVVSVVVCGSSHTFATAACDDHDFPQHKPRNTAGQPGILIFARVIGAIDSTLIPVVNPMAHEPANICQKGNPATDAQITCDAHGLFTNVVATWSGCTHDTCVWANSGLCEVAKDWGFRDSWVLGDCDYPLRPYFLPPVSCPAANTCSWAEV